MDYTKTTTALEDTALSFLLAERNSRLPVPMTLPQFVQAGVDGWFADRVAEYQSKAAGRREAKYQQTTSEDRAALDAIFAKYPDPLTGL